MSKKYHVEWASAAQNDLKQIVEYIATDNPQNTLAIFRKIKQKASGLYTLPDRGRVVPELRDQGIHIYREVIITPWRLIYRVSDSAVFVLMVIDSRRNVEDILLDRLVRKREKKIP